MRYCLWLVKELTCQTSFICWDCIICSSVNLIRNPLPQKWFYLPLHGFYEKKNPVRLVKILPQKCENKPFYSSVAIKSRRTITVGKHLSMWINRFIGSVDFLKTFLVKEITFCFFCCFFYLSKKKTRLDWVSVGFFIFIYNFFISIKRCKYHDRRWYSFTEYWKRL